MAARQESDICGWSTDAPSQCTDFLAADTAASNQLPPAGPEELLGDENRRSELVNQSAETASGPAPPGFVSGGDENDNDGPAAGDANEQEFEAREKVKKYLKGTSIYFQAAGPRDVVLLNAVESGYTVVHNQNLRPADVVWIEASPHTPAQLRDMLPHQRINCIPGMKMCSTKCEFSCLMQRMEKLFPGEYDFIPTTFAIPQETAELRKFGEAHPKQIYVVKPDASCGGDGIYLTDDIKNIRHPECVVQTYVDNPMTIGGLKFDFRLYVVVTSVNPLRFHICKEGLGRMAVEPYEQPSKKNFHRLNMHLTNYSLNKFSSSFVPNEGEDDSECSKRAATTAIRQLNAEDNQFDEDTFWSNFEAIAGKTLAAIVPYITFVAGEATGQPSYLPQCFQVMGFDILVDDNMGMHLLEINHHPSLQTDAPIDMKVKSILLRPVVRMVANYAKRNRCLTKKKQPFVPPTADECKAWEERFCGPDMIPCTDNTHLDRFIAPFRPWRDYFLELTGAQRKTVSMMYNTCPGIGSLKFLKFARSTGITGSPGAPMMTPDVDLLFMKKAGGPYMSFDTFMDLLSYHLGDLLAPETPQCSNERFATLYERLIVQGRSQVLQQKKAGGSLPLAAPASSSNNNDDDDN